MIYANPDDDPRLWGEDPECDERMRLYQADLAEEQRQRQEAQRRESAIRRTIDEVLEEVGERVNTETLRRRLRQVFGLTPSGPL